MKHRVIKKWINRYITPLVEWMPKTNYIGLELVNSNDPSQLAYVSATNNTCVNGAWKKEGEIGAKSKGAYNDIKNTAKALEDCIELFHNPHIRSVEYNPIRGMRIRIYDYKNWPEGYVYRPYPEEMR